MKKMFLFSLVMAMMCGVVFTSCKKQEVEPVMTYHVRWAFTYNSEEYSRDSYDHIRKTYSDALEKVGVPNAAYDVTVKATLSEVKKKVEDATAAAHQSLGGDAYKIRLSSYLVTVKIDQEQVFSHDYGNGRGDTDTRYIHFGVVMSKELFEYEVVDSAIYLVPGSKTQTNKAHFKYTELTRVEPWIDICDSLTAKGYSLNDFIATDFVDSCTCHGELQYRFYKTHKKEYVECTKESIRLGVVLIPGGFNMIKDVVVDKEGSNMGLYIQQMERELINKKHTINIE